MEETERLIRLLKVFAVLGVHVDLPVISTYIYLRYSVYIDLETDWGICWTCGWLQDMGSGKMSAIHL